MFKEEVCIDGVLKMDFLVAFTNLAFLPPIYKKKFKFYSAKSVEYSQKSNSLNQPIGLVKNSLHKIMDSTDIAE